MSPPVGCNCPSFNLLLVKAKDVNTGAYPDQNLFQSTGLLNQLHCPVSPLYFLIEQNSNG